MELKKHVKKFFRRITDWYKARKKRSLRCYWPEINRYCGCCDLTTGIYIRSVIFVILSLITLAINGLYLGYLKSVETIMINLNLTNYDGYIATERDTPEEDKKALFLLYRLIVVYYTIWIIIKATNLAIVFFTVFAIYRKNTRMLKFLLFVTILIWVLDFFISLSGWIILRVEMKIFLIICNLSEGYNILALNSEYKKLRGKPILSAEYIESQQQNRNTCVTEYIPQQPVQINGYAQVHCRTCTCFENPWNIICNEESRPVVISSQPILTTVSENINESFDYTTNRNVTNASLPENTFNDGVPEGNTETASGEAQAVRPNVLEFKIKSKEDVADIPVIYDPQQLNVGSSPVIEDRGVPT